MIGARRHRRTGRLLAVAAVCGLGIAAGGSLVAGPAVSPSDGALVSGDATKRPTSVPAPVRPAFVPGSPEPLNDDDSFRWAPIRRAVTARAAADDSAAIVSRLATATPEGTTNLVSVLGQREDAAGKLWVHVRLPVLPTDRTGWVPRAALGGYGVVHARLLVDLKRLTATLVERGRVVLRADVGIGQDRWPTPKGEFYIRNRLTEYASPTYGPLAFGTSARSRVLTDWPAGGFVGIHGTDQPELLPGKVSHGCIRMRNADILELDRRMPIGTPVTIS